MKTETRFCSQCGRNTPHAKRFENDDKRGVTFLQMFFTGGVWAWLRYKYWQCRVCDKETDR